jgi:hypothetical protein
MDVIFPERGLDSWTEGMGKAGHMGFPFLFIFVCTGYESFSWSGRIDA